MPFVEPRCTALQSARLATKSESASNRAVPRSLGSSFLLREGVEHFADVRQFLARRGLRRQGSHHQTAGRAIEDALEQIAGNLRLGLLPGYARFVHVRSKALTPYAQPLLRPQLHLL